MKLLHVADVHLDSKLKSHLTPEQTKKRKSELLQTFRNMIDYASQNGIQGILISGDLFDASAKYVSKTAKSTVIDSIYNNHDIEFYYLKGNHDEDSFLSEYDSLPDNLHTFNDQWTEYRIGRRVMISGAELNGSNDSALFHSLVLDSKDINIVMLHGQICEYGNGQKEEVVLSDLRNRSIDYLALGHVHAYSREQLDSRGIYCYSGCLEARGFDETGEHGFVVLDINEETGVVTDRFVPFTQRHAYICDVDITGAPDTVTAEKMIESAFEEGGYCSEDMVELCVFGQLDVDSEIIYSHLENVFNGRFFAFKFKKKTTIKVNYDAFALDASLKGEFIRLVREAEDVSEDDKGEIIRLGIELLANPKCLENRKGD